jgi:hypothetical protein
LGLGKNWKVAESRFEPESSIIFLKIEEAPELWRDKSERTRIPTVIHDHVGKSASLQVGAIPPVKSPAR